MTAETKAVGNGVGDSHLTSCIGHVIEIAGGVGELVVDRGVNDTVADAEGADDQLDTAAGAQRMANHALGATDRHLVGVAAEHLLAAKILCGVS